MDFKTLNPRCVLRWSVIELGNWVEMQLFGPRKMWLLSSLSLPQALPNICVWPCITLANTEHPPKWTLNNRLFFHFLQVSFLSIWILNYISSTVFPHIWISRFSALTSMLAQYLIKSGNLWFRRNKVKDLYFKNRIVKNDTFRKMQNWIAIGMDLLLLNSE